MNESVHDERVYTYDELGRLTSVTFQDGQRIVYAYDAAGNITSTVAGPSIEVQLPAKGIPIKQKHAA